MVGIISYDYLKKTKMIIFLTTSLVLSWISLCLWYSYERREFILSKIESGSVTVYEGELKEYKNLNNARGKLVFEDKSFRYDYDGFYCIDSINGVMVGDYIRLKYVIFDELPTMLTGKKECILSMEKVSM
jgi:cell division protein FtsL